MSEDYFGLGGGTGLKHGRMKGRVWGYQCEKYMYMQLSGCLNASFE